MRCGDSVCGEGGGDSMGCLGDGCGVVAEGFDPVDVGLAAEPGELALGVVAVALLGGATASSRWSLAAQDGEGLPVAEGVEGFDGAVAGEEGAGFIDEAGGRTWRRSAG